MLPIRFKTIDIWHVLIPGFQNAKFTQCGIPAYQLRRLQSVMNAAARSITSLRRSDHITDMLASLHWLRSSERIQYKLATTVFGHCMVSPHCTYPTTTFIAWWISRRGDVCGRRLRCSSTCRALVVGLLGTERSLLPVRRSGTACHMTLPTVCHWRHSAGYWKLFCFLYHFHDYIFLFSGPWSLYLGQYNFLYQ